MPDEYVLPIMYDWYNKYCVVVNVETNTFTILKEEDDIATIKVVKLQTWSIKITQELFKFMLSNFNSILHDNKIGYVNHNESGCVSIFGYGLAPIEFLEEMDRIFAVYPAWLFSLGREQSGHDGRSC